MKIISSLFVFLFALVAFASTGHESGAHHEAGIPSVVYYQFLNFGVLLVALIFLTKSKVVDLFTSRRRAYEELLGESQKTLNAALDQRDEVANRLNKMKSNAQKDMENARAESLKEHELKIQEAKAQSLRLQKDIENHISGENMKLFEKLRVEHFNSAREQAEKNLQTKSANSIKNSFSERMKGAMQ